ncbi:hypothetical protein PHISP_07578 [Aspergillus sp. HF37]|nr:hypothetical protein PHISP_07578 [Aspergillus sp. HF37]
MKLACSVLLGVAAGLVHSNPVKKQNVPDAAVLNYALTLEHLEATFYAEGLKNYTHQDFLDAGFPDPFYFDLTQVASDEKAHVQFLTKALNAVGADPVEPCTYSFPAVDPATFVTTANILEGVGASAYTGAAAEIASDKYLTAAASILGVEGRHSSFFRASLGLVPFRSFEVPLTFDEVYTLAARFIVSCPDSNVKLPVMAFPSLFAILDSETAMTGSNITLKAGESYTGAEEVHAAFVTVTGPVWAKLEPMGNGTFTAIVPKGIQGQSYVVLTKSDEQVTDDTILAGPAVLQVGPVVGTAECTTSGSTGGGTPTTMTAGAMTSGIMPTRGAIATSSRPSASVMPSGSGSRPPVFTGAASKNMGGIIGAIGVSVIAIAFTL